MKISLTRTLQISFNILIVAFSLGTYSFISKQIRGIFALNDRAMNQQKAEFIAKSIRPMAPSRDYVAMRMAFKNALNDSSVQMVRFVPDDSSEGICVAAQGEGCFSQTEDASPVFTTKLYFDPENKQPMGAVRVRFQNDGSAKIDRAIQTYIGVALFLVVTFFNFMIFFSFRSIRQQIEWSIEAVRRITRGEQVPLQKSVLVEKSRFSSALADLTRVLEDYKVNIEQASKKAAFVEIAKSVAHDIRDPLLALDSALPFLDHLPESKRVVTRKAIVRIRDIATSLISKSKSIGQVSEKPAVIPTTKENRSVELLSTLIETIVAEKRMQFRSHEKIEIQSLLEEKSYGIFIDVNASELHRVLSNLINNAVEAMGDDGRVVVSTEGSTSLAKIKVVDNGKGMPESVRRQVLLGAGTFGKANGNGIGLRSAMAIVKSWGGSLDIESRLGIGTAVSITLPSALTPSWFVPKLAISPGDTFCVLDDDDMAHHTWDHRFKRAGTPMDSVHLWHFYSANDLMDWYFAHPTEAAKAMFFCDYELLNQNLNGLEVIKILKIEQQSVLVTSRYDEQAIREKCIERGVRLIPKPMLSLIPIHWKAEVAHHANAIS